VPDFNGHFLNPLYSPELAQYFSRQWWSCVVLWSNLIRRIAKQERRTTATIEVYHKILKTMDISKRSLPLDQYLYARAAVIRANQQLIAEKIMFVGSKKALPLQMKWIMGKKCCQAFRKPRTVSERFHTGIQNSRTEL